MEISVTFVMELAKNVMWNGMLALIPVAVAYLIALVCNRLRAKAARYAVVGVLSVLWLVFLPNTCYLLTEWRHLLLVVDAENLYLRSGSDNILRIKLLIASLFYFFYSGFGMVTFAFAIRPVERLAIRRGVATRFWALPFFVSLSLGVYLGLILRFNTWDLATQPSMVWRAIVEAGGRPLLAAFIIAFGVFLWIAYEALDIWVDGLKLRLKGEGKETA